MVIGKRIITTVDIPEKNVTHAYTSVYDVAQKALTRIEFSAFNQMYHEYTEFQTH